MQYHALRVIALRCDTSCNAFQYVQSQSNAAQQFRRHCTKRCCHYFALQRIQLAEGAMKILTRVKIYV
jgi:hypothetical protein